MTKSDLGLSRRNFLIAGAVSPLAAMMGARVVSAAGSRVKLQFMYPVGVSGNINQIVSGMIAEFNDTHPDVEIEAIYAGSYDNTEQKVITSLGVGTPPAAWLPINSALQTFRGLDAVADITDLAKADDVYQDMLPGFLNTCISDDRLYGLPYQASTPVLYYNKDAFKAAGIEKAPDTWDELLAAAKVLTQRKGDDVKRWGLTIGGGWHDWSFESFVRQNAFVPWDKEQVYFDAPEAIDALEFWLKMVNEGVMPKATTWQGAANDFMAGQSAMLYHSTGSLTNLRTSSPFEVGVAFMPKNKTYGAAMGGGPIMIAKNQPDSHIEATYKFARWMTNTENQTNWGKATGYLATRKSSWESADMQAFVKEVPAAKIALDQAEYAGAFMQVPAYHRVREYLKSAIDRTLAGEIDPKTALVEANTNANREIKRVLRRQG